MNAQAVVSMMPEHVLEVCPSNATQRNATNATNATLPRQGKSSRVPDAPTPVDSEVQVTESDVIRTRVVLEGIAGEQDRLAGALRELPPMLFADRADWLIAHRTADEQLAWRRLWASRGVRDSEPTIRFDRPSSLAAPKRRRPVKFTDRQMEIAMSSIARRAA